MKRRRIKSGYSVVVTLKSGEVQVGEPFPTEAQAKSYRKYLRRGRGRWSSVRSIKILTSNRRRGLRRNQTPMERLRYHVSGAIARGEAEPIVEMRSHNSRGQKLYVVITADGTPLSGRIGTLEPPGPIFYTKGEAIKKARMFRGRVVSVESYYKMSRGLRRNEEYARQIPRRDRPMRGRGFDKRFDVSAGSDYNDLYKILTTGRNPGTTKKIGDNTYLFFEKRAPMGYPPILEGPIVVKLYQTPILTYYPNGEVDVNFGGYMTTTTFSRINNLVPYGWNLRKKAGKLALENSWGQRAVIRKPRAGEEYAVRLTSDKAYLID